MDLHILFFILAGLLIVILIGNSILSARREKSRVFEDFSRRPMGSALQNNENIADVEPLKPIPSTPLPSDNIAQPYDEIDQQEIQKSVESIVVRLADQPLEQPTTPDYTVEPYNTATPPAYSPESDQRNVTIQDPINIQLHTAEPAHSESEPVIEPIQQDILTLYVVSPENQPFNGGNVIHALDTLGFQYGEHQIFHRHIDNTASPVIFSVANMMQPGIFDLNNIEHFSTIGLVFFMSLPSVGNDMANLRLLIHTTKTLADTLGGFVLDENRELFDQAAQEDYVARVAALHAH